MAPRNSKSNSPTPSSNNNASPGGGGGGPPPSHPLELDPSHRKYLSRSLNRNDAELAALQKLHVTLRTVRDEIVERYGEGLLLDVGEGVISLSPDGSLVGLDEDDEDARKKGDLCRDFLFRIKLRRRLLNRLARRLNRLSHAMDGENVAPPLPPKYGDLRFRVDQEALGKFLERRGRVEGAKRRVKELRRRDAFMKEEEVAARIWTKEEDGVEERGEDFGLEGVVVPQGEHTEDGSRVSKAERRPMQAVSSASLASAAVHPSDTLPSSAATSTTNALASAPQSQRHQTQPANETSNDMDLITEYNPHYEKLYSPSTKSTRYSLLNCDPRNNDPNFEEDHVAIKYGAGIGATHRTMSAREKANEWKRWQNDVLGRVPDQPTFEELGMVGRVFHLEARRKRVREEEEKKEEHERRDKSLKETEEEAHESEDAGEKDDKFTEGPNTKEDKEGDDEDESSSSSEDSSESDEDEKEEESDGDEEEDDDEEETEQDDTVEEDSQEEEEEGVADPMDESGHNSTEKNEKVGGLEERDIDMEDGEEDEEVDGAVAMDVTQEDTAVKKDIGSIGKQKNTSEETTDTKKDAMDETAVGEGVDVDPEETEKDTETDLSREEKEKVEDALEKAQEEEEEEGVEIKAEIVQDDDGDVDEEETEEEDDTSKMDVDTTTDVNEDADEEEDEEEEGDEEDGEEEDEEEEGDEEDDEEEEEDEQGDKSDTKSSAVDKNDGGKTIRKEEAKDDNSDDDDDSSASSKGDKAIPAASASAKDTGKADEQKEKEKASKETKQEDKKDDIKKETEEIKDEKKVKVVADADDPAPSPPKKIKPFSLAPVPSFLDQDLKRVRHIHADLLAASIHEHARRRIAEVTNDYNRAFRTSTEILNRRSKITADLNKMLFQHRMTQNKRKTDYALEIAIARAKYQKRKEVWAAQRAAARQAREQRERARLMQQGRAHHGGGDKSQSSSSSSRRSSTPSENEARIAVRDAVTSLVDRVVTKLAPKELAIGTPRTASAAMKPHQVVSAVGATLGHMVDCVAKRTERDAAAAGGPAPGGGSGLSPGASGKDGKVDIDDNETFEEFQPPPPSEEAIVDPATGETLSDVHDRLENNVRKELSNLAARLQASEEERKKAWRKMLKTKAEYEVPHHHTVPGRRSRVPLDPQQMQLLPVPPLKGTVPSSGGGARGGGTPAPGTYLPVATALPTTGYVPPNPAALAALTAASTSTSSRRRGGGGGTTSPGGKTLSSGTHSSAASTAAAVGGAGQGGGGRTPSDSKYSAAKVKERIFADGSVMPVTMPKKNKDGLFQRPAGRKRKGMDWDAVRGRWIPAKNVGDGGGGDEGGWD